MGLDYFDAKTLFEARLAGASFDRTLTIAHLSLKLHPAEVGALRRIHSRLPQRGIAPLAGYAQGDYCDQFLREFLGVSSLTVLDYSNYEGANRIQDMNQPVPDDLVGQFDAVIDGGSLEHIFNFPVAIANMMRMAKIGGRVFLKSPANNLCGHGFYQFSPELMFRVFAPENGFELVRVALLEFTYPTLELTPLRAVYEAVDPKAVGARAMLLTGIPVMMAVEARKTADVPLFSTAPLQSDYVADWSQRSAKRSRGAAEKVLRRLPASVQARILGWREKRRYSLSNRRFYKPVR